MLGIPNPYAIAGGLALGVAALSGAFVMGDSVGANRVIARDAKALQHANDAMQRAIGRMNTAQDALAAKEGQRRETVREIYRVVPTIIDRPVYRAVCIDDDGVRLLQRAAEAANGGGSEPAAGTGQTAGGDVHR